MVQEPRARETPTTGDWTMRRRDVLAAGSAALLGLATFPCGWVAAASKRRQRVLYFTRSVEYEHSVVRPGEDGLSHSGRILTQLGRRAGFDVECTKDGSVFDGDLQRWDVFVFYSCGDMFQPSVRKRPPMSPAGRDRLVAAVAAGKPFVALHSACYWGRQAPADDPYLAMIGARFVAHGAQQEATMRVASPGFPGTEGLPKSFRLTDEWYALRDFADNLHVILVQETAGMEGDMYQRPPFPATWARMHGQGRVFFCSMGHREDVWTNRIFQQILLGGIAWALGNAQANTTPNIHQVTPRANQLHP
ncbi:MAG TPA: ThuA domain-containing protein [Planctomycetes bacterium]|nr:ThuA domain-containing protein [Planctomycetota bacterium]